MCIYQPQALTAEWMPIWTERKQFGVGVPDTVEADRAGGVVHDGYHAHRRGDCSACDSRPERVEASRPGASHWPRRSRGDPARRASLDARNGYFYKKNAPQSPRVVLA